MKNVKITSRFIKYSFVFVFVLMLNISGGKSYKVHNNESECYDYLVQMNQTLQQDPDGILNPDQVEYYQECVKNIEEIDLNNVSNFILLLDSYTNLMDYYTYQDVNDEAAEAYEDAIYSITE